MGWATSGDSLYSHCRGGEDIRFTTHPRPNVEKDVKLSKKIGPDAAKEVASLVRNIKGYAGGRFYVNEFCSVFVPIQEGWETDYIYAGQIDLENWFPAPHSE